MSQVASSLAPFMELPNELILIIAEDLDDDSLLHLAATCRRVNFLLPGIFARFGFELPESFSGLLPSLFINGESLKLLRAIGIASFITSINTIDCVFTPQSILSGGLSLKIEDILPPSKALNSLATGLSNLGHLRVNPYARLHATEDISRWLSAVASFLNSAVQRGDCAITVYCVPGGENYTVDPRPFLHFIPDVPPSHALTPRRQAAPTFSVLAVLQRLVSLFRSFPTVDPDASPPAPRPAEILRSTPRSGVVTLPLPTHPAVKTLNIRAPLLFHATFYKWTLHVLNTAPITTLSLDFIALSHYDWALTLPALTLPALSSLTIGPQPTISVPDLTRFLARHSAIHTLDLSFHLAIGPLAPPVVVLERLLPRLETLRATPDYLLYFLTGEDGGAAYPRLRRVGVTSDDDSKYQIAQFARLVACVEVRRVVPRVELAGKLGGSCRVPAHLQ
ncbi:hypothetical protein B0H13DRAFT_2659720 [Mycena leptocephala]|nr:hypothetical protein B0H13DRAFT_2659720 [Mycena leptocephala]